MSISKLALLGSVSALALISACAPYPTRSDAYGGAPAPTVIYSNAQYGYVDRIELVSRSTASTGGGAVLGAVIGAVVGNQIGSGSGRAAATGIGAVGGAVIGNSMENRNRASHEVYRVSVRLETGDFRQFDYQDIGDLRVGDRIRIEGEQIYR